MNNNYLHKTLAVASVSVLLGWTSAVSAHEQIGTLGGNKSAVDVYQVTCDGNSHHLSYQVWTAQPKKGPKVSLLAFKTTIASNTTDGKSGNAGYSPLVKLAGQGGVYYLFVSKNGKAARNYKVEYHCEDGGGGHTGTSIAQLQNQ